MENTTGDFCRVHFRVRCLTEFGQTVAVSGSTFALGCFNRQKTVPLVTTPESFPVWYTAQPVVVPRKEVVHYKFCIIEGGVLKAFEKRERDSARVIVPDALDCVLEDSFAVASLEGAGQDSEMHLFEEIKRIQRRTSGTKLLEAAALNANAAANNNINNNNIHKGAVAALMSEESEPIEGEMTPLRENGRLFLVCYHLPVTVERNPKAESEADAPFRISWSESLIAKSSHSVAESTNTIWVGTLSVNKLNLTGLAEREKLVQMLKEMNCIPIFLDSDVAYAAYHGFCKQVMWPVFHNVDQLDHIHAAWNLPPQFGGAPTITSPASATFSSVKRPPAGKGIASTVTEWNVHEDSYHLAYEQVNRIFFETVFAHNITPQDVVWVHDYHLMLLPKHLRERCPDCRIVFFLHIPFPTSQIFRTLPKANELLESMTSSDVVGFHAFDHTRHFLNATKRLLGIRSYTRPGGMLSLMVRDREVVVTMSHVGVETDALDRSLADPYTQTLAKEMREKYAGRKIVVGIDICQRLSGCALKLAAFDKLLSDYTGDTAQTQPVLVQRCILQNSRVEDEQTTASDLRKMSADINAKYARSARASSFSNLTAPIAPAPPGSDPADFSTAQRAADGSVLVDYQEISGAKMSLRERVALYLCADVFLLTHIREGLNLLPLEYIYARRDLAFAGCVVVSEFSTCSSLLNGSLKVNPFSTQAVADALDKALHLTSKDASYRRQRDMDFISSHPSSMWTKQILGDLEQLRPVGINPDTTCEGPLGGKVSSANLTALGVVGAAPPAKMPKNLDTSYMLHCYEKAGREQTVSTAGSRLFVVDYGGTLLHKEKYDIYIKTTLSAISGRKPTPRMMEAVRRLSEDPRNIVMVVTGLTKMKLKDTFRGMNNVTLVTSNGLVYSWGDNIRNAGFVKALDMDIDAPPPPPPLSLATSTASAGGKKRGGEGKEEGAVFAVEDSESEDISAQFMQVVEDSGKHSSSTSSPPSEAGGTSDKSTQGSTVSSVFDQLSLHPVAMSNMLPVSSHNFSRNTINQINEYRHGQRAETESIQASQLRASALQGESDGRVWEFLSGDVDWNAVSEIALPIMTKFTFRTNGTCKTPRVPGIGWSYFGADPDWGEKQADQLKIELEAALANFDVKVTSLIQGSIEVVPTDLQKGILVRRLLERVCALRCGRLPAFAAVIGDETSDDMMHQTLYEFIGEAPAVAEPRRMKAFTVNVGKRESPAQFYVNDVKAVEDVLFSLASSETTAKLPPTGLDGKQQQQHDEEDEGVAMFPPPSPTTMQ